MNELDRLLTSLPEGRDIERHGLEARKADLERALSAESTREREPLRAQLTFRGRPTVGSHGIFAEFAAGAVEAFARVVSTVGASLTGPLGTRGQLPNQDQFRLLITGTAHGSFGFQFEEAAVNQAALFDEESPLEAALERTRAIMEATLGDDDELSDSLAEVDPRAVEAMRRFLDELVTHDAVCSFAFRDRVFRYPDIEQLRIGSSRLREENIHEVEESKTGEFLGVLPTRRTFEFRVADTGEVISGKVGRNVDDPAAINELLRRQLTVRVYSRRVGHGRPKYVLQSLADSEPMNAGGASA